VLYIGTHDPNWQELSWTIGTGGSFTLTGSKHLEFHYGWSGVGSHAYNFDDWKAGPFLKSETSLPVITITPSGSAKDGIFYGSADITATAADAESGVNDSTWQHSVNGGPWQAGNTIKDLTNDVPVVVQFRVSDNVTNVATQSMTVNFDKIPPDRVNLSDRVDPTKRNLTASLDPSGVPYVMATWKAVSDQPLPVNSGVVKYEVKLTGPDNIVHTYEVAAVAEEQPGVTTYDFSSLQDPSLLLPRGTQYKVSVIASDYWDNHCAQPAATDIDTVMTPPKALAITQVKSEPTVRTAKYLPLYKNGLVLESIPSDFDATKTESIDHHEVWRGSTAGTPEVFARSFTPAEAASFPTDSGKTIYFDTMTDALYAHKIVFYTIKTVYKYRQALEWSNSSPCVTRNYPGEFAVTLSNTVSGQRFVVGSTAGPGTAASITTNAASNCQLSINNLQDIEGDKLGFSITDPNDPAQTIYHPPDQTPSVINLGSVILTDAQRTFFVSVSESNTAAGYVNPDSYAAGRFTVTLDSQKPLLSGSALALPSDARIVYDSAHPTSAAILLIKDIASSDEGGTVHSGVETLRVWNVLSNGNTANLTTLPWDSTQHLLSWTLDSSCDGPKTVCLQVIDKAGNASDVQTLTTILDSSAPAASTGFAFGTPSFDETNSLIALGWTDFTDNLTDPRSLQYQVSVNGTVRGQTRPPFTLSSAGLEPNTKLALVIQAVDAAGNLSAPVSYDNLYAPAKLGTLDSVIIKAAETGASHQYTLTWTLGVTGVAARQVLRVWYAGANDPNASTAHDIELSGSSFVVNGMSPRAAVKYQLVAINACGFETSGGRAAVAEYQIPNSVPQKPVLAGPSGLSTASPMFSWSAAVDSDGDAVSYTLWYRSAADTSWKALGQVLDETNASYTFFPSGSFVDGLAFTWKVSASDANGGLAESDPASFTVDDTPPKLTADSIPLSGGLFSNASSFTMTGSDANGIAKIQYWTSDGVVSGGSPAEAQLATDASGKTVGTILLHESIKGSSGKGVPYQVNILVRDAAGNSSSSQTPTLRVDWSAPSIASVRLNTPVVNGVAASASGLFTVTAATSDDWSGVRELRYGWVISPTDTPAQEQVATLTSVANPDGSSGSHSFTMPVTLSGTNGKSYYLVARVLDWAGNSSVSVSAGSTVLLDTSPPNVSLAVNGLHSSAGQLYLADPSGLTVTCTCTDAETSASSEFALVQQGASAPAAVWRVSFESAKASLVSGQSYQIALRGTNATGGTAMAYGPVFTYDLTTPVALSASGTGLSDLVTSQCVRIQVSATDPESGISSFALAIGSSAGATDISARVLGNVGGLLRQAATGAAAEFSFVIPQVPDGSYYLGLSATNGSGLQSTASIQNITLEVDNSQEKLVVSDGGPYSGSATTLRASWLYHGAKGVTGYQYRIVGTGGAIKDWTSISESCVVAGGLSLVHGESCHFEVMATFTDGTSSAVASSAGVRVDLTLAQFASVGGFTVPAAAPSNGLRIGWNVNDAESGIASLAVVVESYDVQGNIVRVASDPVTLGALPSAQGLLLSSDNSGVSLPFTTGQKVLLTLRVTNGAGATVDRTASVVVIDGSAPPRPVVVDQGNVINTSQYMGAQWVWTPGDPESQTTDFQWAIVHTPEEVPGATWHDAGVSTSINLKDASGIDESTVMVDKSVWFFAVKARNGAGLESIGLSNGITYDATAPLLATVKLLNVGNNPAVSADINYITSIDNLLISIAATEDVTQQMSYQVDTGKLENGEWILSDGQSTLSSAYPLIPLSNLLIPASQITMFRGQVINQAELVSEYGYTQGVMLDANGPQILRVNARMAGRQLYYDWDVQPGSAPVAHYQVALLPVERASGTPSESEWVDLGVNQSATFDQESGLAPGSYVLFVKARDAAGLESAIVKSGAATFDVTPPVVSALKIPAYASSRITLDVSTQDLESGVSEYQYCIGTFENLAAFSGGWIDYAYRGTHWVRKVEFASLPANMDDGIKIRVSLRVRNGAGVWSESVISAEILIDKTKASVPVVGAGVYTTYRTKVENIGLFSMDLQSGITAIKIAAVQGTNQPMPAEAIVISTNGFVGGLSMSSYTLDGLLLGEGGQYYVAVAAQNGAGDWSEVGYSAVITVDTIPPTISFEGGATFKVINVGPTTVGYSLSEASTVSLTIVNPGGYARALVSFDALGGENRFPFGETGEGTYTILATLKDKAGNVGNSGTEAAKLLLRINAAPKTFLAPVSTTPGKPLRLSANAFDPDGDNPISYLWDFGDGSTGSGDTLPAHIYYQSSAINQVSIYILSLTVMDGLGKSTTVSTTVTVDNTSAGSLYTNEYWSGVHEVRGDITVPAGTTLTVAANATVKVAGAYQIKVDGSLSSLDGAIFRLESQPPLNWSGLVIGGRAAFQGSRVQDAVRAVTALAGSSVSITGCTFVNNLIGLHAYASQPVVSNSRFQTNRQYGVKEDGGGRPSLQGCVFTGNLYDYYSGAETVIDVARINTINGNSGNRSE